MRLCPAHRHRRELISAWPAFFNSGNGLTPVDARWFRGHRRAEVLGVQVYLTNMEDSLLTKCSSQAMAALPRRQDFLAGCATCPANAISRESRQRALLCRSSFARSSRRSDSTFEINAASHGSL